MNKQIVMLGVVLAAMPVLSMAQESAMDELKQAAGMNKAPVVAAPEIKGEKIVTAVPVVGPETPTAVNINDIRGYDFWVPKGTRVEHALVGIRVNIDLTLRFIYETHGKMNDYTPGRMTDAGLDSKGRRTARIKLDGGAVYTAAIGQSAGSDGTAPVYTMWVSRENGGIFGPLNGSVFERVKIRPPQPPVSAPITAADLKGLQFWILSSESIREGDLYGVWIEDDLSARVIYLADGKRNKARYGKIVSVTPGAAGQSIAKIAFDYGKDTMLANIRPAAEDLKQSLAQFGKVPRYEMWMEDNDPAVNGNTENYLYDNHYEAN